MLYDCNHDGIYQNAITGLQKLTQQPNKIRMINLALFGKLAAKSLDPLTNINTEDCGAWKLCAAWDTSDDKPKVVAKNAILPSR